MKFGYNLPSSFRGEDVWTDDNRRRRTTESACTKSSPGAFGSCELRILIYCSTIVTVHRLTGDQKILIALSFLCSSYF